MGEQEGCVPFNGLRCGEPSESILRVLDSRRWMMAEERAAELIACIKPNRTSELQRLAVADYVRRLVMQCFPCQVFTFGSVPLKTYLPDGDIDLATFSGTPDVKDSWAKDVHDMLESEGKKENAEFIVKDVQFIQAEVKLVKCVVGNIVVDISFNQIGGLCTLCFLEQVDLLISHNHLFKRSIILIKAWCYYESRILGAHHGLISTYALETLVLYIFHVFNDTFKGPLEVLYRFLEFFSKFDWEKFCVSLWGPVPVDSLPDITVEPPRKDSRELLLRHDVLGVYSSMFGDHAPQDLQTADFPKRSFNVVDPLRINNNLGRSVSKGNFFRIRSAFAFGAMKLGRLLDCSEEDLYAEINQFFVNTWQRHGNRIRPDAPCMIPRCIRPSSPDSSNRPPSNVGVIQEPCSIEHSNASTVSRSPTWKNQAHDLGFRRSSQIARTHSSPELTDLHSAAASQFKPADNKNCGISSTRSVGMDSMLSKNEAVKTLNTMLVTDTSTSSCSVSKYSADSEVSSTRYQNSFLDEEHDSEKMMGSSMFHGFSGHFNWPGHLPSISLPILTPFSSGQQIVGGTFPGNIPVVENPWAANMQFTAVPPPMTHYFHGLSSTNSELSDTPYEGAKSADMSSWEAESRVWHDHDGSSNGGFDLDNGSSEVSFDDDRQMSEIHYNDEKNELLRNNSSERRYRKNMENGAVQHTDSRTLLSGSTSTLRSKTASESPVDRTAGKGSKVTKERRGMKLTHPGMQSVANEKSETVSIHSSTHTDDEYVKNWKPITNLKSIDRNDELPLSGLKHQLPGFELAQESGMQSLNHQFSGTDDRGVPPIPTGPPVPFLTRFTVYNVPSEAGTSSMQKMFFTGNDRQDKSGFIRMLHPSLLSSSVGPVISDILDSDVATHLLNLDHARSCRSSQQAPAYTSHYPSVYQLPTGGLCRPVPGKSNFYTPVTGGGGRVIPVVAPLPYVSSQPAVTGYPQIVEDTPRHRGTGTFLPNHVNVKDRQVLGSRRNTYHYDRSDPQNPQSDKERNSFYGKPRAAGRNHNRNQYEKGKSGPNPKINRLLIGESGAEGQWVGSYRSSELRSQNIQVDSMLSPTMSQSATTDMAYDMHSPFATGVNGVTPIVPPLMMYPYGQWSNTIGSFGPVHLSGIYGFSQVSDAKRPSSMPEEQKFQSNRPKLSSPDQPSSSYFQDPLAKGKYQMTERKSPHGDQLRTWRALETGKHIPIPYHQQDYRHPHRS